MTDVLVKGWGPLFELVAALRALRRSVWRPSSSCRAPFRWALRGVPVEPDPRQSRSCRSSWAACSFDETLRTGTLDVTLGGRRARRHGGGSRRTLHVVTRSPRSTTRSRRAPPSRSRTLRPLAPGAASRYGSRGGAPSRDPTAGVIAVSTVGHGRYRAPASLTPVERPIRVAFVGLGRIYDLNKLAYVDNDDVEVVALVDPERRATRPAPTRLAERADVLRPSRNWRERRRRRRGRGAAADRRARGGRPAVPASGLARQSAKAHRERSRERPTHVARRARARSAAAGDGELPLLRATPALKEIVDAGELGEISGYHMKMVASGRGGWDVPGRHLRATVRTGSTAVAASSSSTTAGTSSRRRSGCSARCERSAPGSARPRSFRGSMIDAPTTVVWEHENGVRGVWDITLAVDMYLRSDYYTNDERWEVTGRRGFARVNRCTGRGHPAAQPRGVPRRRDALVPRARRRLGEQFS